MKRTIGPVRVGDLVARLPSATLTGDPDVTVEGMSPLDAPAAGTLGFAKEVRYLPLADRVRKHGWAALVVSDRVRGDLSALARAVVAVPDPLFAVTLLVPFLYRGAAPGPGVSPRADVHPSAFLGERVHVGPFAVIGEGVTVGDDAVVHAHAVLYPYSSVGARTTVHAGAVVREWCAVDEDAVIQNGAVIGADGFGYVHDPATGLVPVPQVGTASLGKRTEVGACTSIDRATFGVTSVGDGTKIDNLAQIGHNVRIGRHSVVCGQAGVAGSATVGDRVVLGGQSGVKDHVTITDGVRVAARGGVVGDITVSGDYAGFPARPASQWRRQAVAIEKLPEVLGSLGKPAAPKRAS